MADLPERISPLAGVDRPGCDPVSGGEAARISIEERRGLAIAQLEVRDLGHPGLASIWSWAGMGAAPAANRAGKAAGNTALWTGPGRWLLVTGELADDALAAELRARVGAGAAITELGHARTVLRVTGAAAAEVLAKGCPVDVETMDGNDCCVSLLAHNAVLIHRLERDEGFDVYVARSYARALCEWLDDAATEYRSG